MLTWRYILVSKIHDELSRIILGKLDKELVWKSQKYLCFVLSNPRDPSIHDFFFIWVIMQWLYITKVDFDSKVKKIAYLFLSFFIIKFHYFKIANSNNIHQCSWVYFKTERNHSMMKIFMSRLWLIKTSNISKHVCYLLLAI